MQICTHLSIPCTAGSLLHRAQPCAATEGHAGAAVTVGDVQGPGCSVGEVTESREYKKSRLAPAPSDSSCTDTGESEQSTVLVLFCEDSSGQRSQLTHTGCSQWFFTVSASAMAKQKEGWG